MDRKLIILDGGMGTDLIEAGLRAGEKPEIFGMEHPEILREIHRKYIAAGSDYIYTDTFGASRQKLAGTGHSVPEVIARNVQTAKEAAEGTSARIALDIGPLGELLEPFGTLTFEEAIESFREIVIAGRDAGADAIIIETMTDLYETRAAVLAAKENSDLPVWVTMTFEKNHRTFLGTSVPSFALTMDGLGVDAIGINCSLGPDEILPIAEELIQWTDKPLIIKPNAGLPDPETGVYPLDAKDFAEMMLKFEELGVSMVGGCCGTHANYIEAISAVMKGHAVRERAARTRNGVCGFGQVAEYGKLNPIGERINPTGKKKLQKALLEEDMDYIRTLAVEQADAGARILDINVGAPGVDEVALMPKVVKAVQSVVSLPLQIDSADPAVLEAGLRVCNGRPIINSVNGEQERMDAVFPLAQKYGAALLGLTMDESGLPTTTEERVAVADKIITESKKYDIAQEDLIMDCLTLTVSAQQDQAIETLNAVRRIHEEYGMHCALGVSNISFGLPMRMHITASFLSQAMYCGLDFPIVNMNETRIQEAIASFRVLSGEDVDSADYIALYSRAEAERKARLKAAKAAKGSKDEKAAGASDAQASATVSKEAAGTTVSDGAGASGLPSDAETAPNDVEDTETRDPMQRMILKGLKKETEEMTEQLLQTMPAMDIINEKIIPALDLVGKLYEEGEFFLPQLLNSANAACAGMDLLKAALRANGEEGERKDCIVIATVQGDIHDIGKNIVKVVLENYGYEVVDLGRDVPPETVVEAVKERDAKLVGLSALMTTTVPAMKETIEALRAAGCDCKIMVGGAVLTSEFAMSIGADYYAKDAQRSANIAKEVLG